MINNEGGGMLMRVEEVLKRWRDCFGGLINVEKPQRKERERERERESGA